MNVVMEQTWKQVLSEEFEKQYFHDLANRVRREYLEYTVYPPPRSLFSAFDLCPFDAVRVVIIGQDPYHGPRQAHGLCFSVVEGVSIPPSLQNIYREIENDLGVVMPTHGNLSGWARQGVLLLNSILTVRRGAPGSHSGIGWERFTDAVIAVLNTHRDHLVFLLWGQYARRKGGMIDRDKHLVLEASHPSPFSAHSGFFGCRHFSRTNDFLRAHAMRPIVWDAL